MTKRGLICGSLFCVLVSGVMFSRTLGVVRAQASQKVEPLASTELDVPGVVAEVFESARKEGVLTVRVRFRNTGSETASLTLASAGNYNDNYITAADTKYPVMRDAKNYVVATPMDPGGDLSARITKGGTWNWWAKFAAPPAGISTYTLYLKIGPPVEDIPIVDK
jgi:hypothetical protein